MRRISIMMLGLILVLIFASCDAPLDTSNQTTAGKQPNQTLPENNVDIEYNAWELGEFTDEFKKPTGEKYVVTTAYDGTFSNSATTNSDLIAAVQVTDVEIAIMLWEYGNHLVKGTFDYEDYSITVLDQDNQKHYLSGTIYQGGNRIYVDSKDRYALLQLLRQDGEISFYLESSKYSTSTYLFTIVTTGFAPLYYEIGNLK